jgi:integrase
VTATEAPDPLESATKTAEMATEVSSGAVNRSGLLGKLMAAIRVEFRRDDLIFDATDPVFGGPGCAVDGCVRPARQRGLCLGHRRRWAAAGKPDLAEFAATTDPRWNRHRALGSCEVPSCHYGLQGHGMCRRHARQWEQAGRPDLVDWQGQSTVLPPPSPPPLTCQIDYCDLWAHSDSPLCANHHDRWKAQDHPNALGEFVASCENPGLGSEHINLRGLPPHLRLEMQYVLQSRGDEKTAKISPDVTQRIIHTLAATGVTSMLDRPESAWKRFRPSNSTEGGWRTFALDAYHRIQTLAEGQGWEVEYPRDTWRLANLGIRHKVANVTFEPITQPWLKALAKRWARWQLTTGLGAGSVGDGSRALHRFSAFCARPSVGVDTLAQVDRPLLERYLADLHTEMAGRNYHTYHVSAINAFLLAIHQHHWDDSLPTSAMLFREDFPKRGDRLPRALAEQVMTQVEHPASLARWNNPDYRLVTLILMRCGLRVHDALNLPADCIVRDADQAPYLRYYNHKMKREALVPIDEELNQQIRDQRQRCQTRWPDGIPILFPRPTANLTGHRPLSSGTYRGSLNRWLRRCDIRDAHDQPVRLTPHQWRHTLGTRLINRDVPQEVVRKILDHDSPEMTAHYARLHDTTVRRHWEAARTVNVSGDTVIFDPTGPLADAVWAKERLSRATQALPNGYCGLPSVRSCPHANACLTCPMFLITAEFLPHHRCHHQQTLQMIATAEARGQTRIAEMNRQIATNLEKIITALETDKDSQKVTDVS